MTSFTMNPRGLALLKHYEQGPHGGPALFSYRDDCGYWTIGYGIKDGVHGGMCITPANADRMLCDALAARESRLNAVLEGVPTTSDQFSAMLLLLYNIGWGDPNHKPEPIEGFLTSSVLRKHRALDHAGAAQAFSLWDKGTVNGHLQVLEGLVKRRADEARLYLSKIP